MEAVTKDLPRDLDELRGDGAGSSSQKLGGQNVYGDSQLKIDVAADKVIFAALEGKCAVCSSEEQSVEVQMGGKDMCVVFDPLDGSSIVETNFAVGTIFGIYRGRSLKGVRGRHQVAAGYALYGPRTDFIIATKAQDAYALHHLAWCQSSWHTLKPLRVAAHRKLFAPANWRCCGENQAYKELVQGWLDRGYTLRYSGGMVPDVHHILVKGSPLVTACAPSLRWEYALDLRGWMPWQSDTAPVPKAAADLARRWLGAQGGGVFCSPRSQSHKAKLRLLYECAPLAFVMEAAGGGSRDATGSILDQEVQQLDQTTVVALGALDALQECVAALEYAADL